MIAITAATGTTGRHVLRSLSSAGHDVRALVHSGVRLEEARSYGAHEAVVADLTRPDDLAAALNGCDALVHIGPPMNSREITMGQNVLDAAKQAGIRHVLLMSVAHPQLEPLLNHQSKLAVERHLLASRLPFTILQPVHYMQNVDVADCLETGIFRQPYCLDRPLSFVDLADVGEVAATVLSDPAQHLWATYELCGTDTLTGHGVARVLTETGGTTVRAEQVDVLDILPDETPDYTVDGFIRLTTHYDRYGLLGNPNVLRWLLSREPTTLAQYAHRELR